MTEELVTRSYLAFWLSQSLRIFSLHSGRGNSLKLNRFNLTWEQKNGIWSKETTISSRKNVNLQGIQGATSTSQCKASLKNTTSQLSGVTKANYETNRWLCSVNFVNMELSYSGRLGEGDRHRQQLINYASKIRLPYKQKILSHMGQIAPTSP